MAPPQPTRHAPIAVQSAGEPPRPVSLWAAIGCILGFIVVVFGPQYLISKTYLSLDGLTVVREVVVFPSLLAWWAIYLSSTSGRIRVVATISCLIILVVWLILTVRKEHQSEVDTLKHDNAIWCQKADSEAHFLDQIQTDMKIGVQYRTRTIPLDEKLRKIKAKPPFTIEDLKKAEKESGYSDAYQKMQDGARNSFLQEAHTLNEIDEEIQKRLGRKQNLNNGLLALDIRAARDMPEMFIPIEYGYLAKYMSDLSKELCPVNTVPEN